MADELGILPSMANGVPTGSVVRYVALGDSYTIGTSVAAAERFPDQLVASFRPAGPRFDSWPTSGSTATPRPT